MSTQLDENDTVCTTTVKPAGNNPHYDRHHIAALNADILIRTLPSQGLSFQLWPAATSLFSLLQNHRNDVIPRLSKILELGSGTGLVGIAAAAILGADVTLTDLPHVVPNLDHNAAANSLVVAAGGGTVRTAALAWGNEEHMAAIGRGEHGVILGSDVVYHDHLFEPLIETLKYFLLGEEQVVFVMAHLKRWKKESVFFKKARKFFDVEVVHRDGPSEGNRVGVIVYRFVGKRKVRSGVGSGSGSGSSSSLVDPKELILDSENGVWL